MTLRGCNVLLCVCLALAACSDNKASDQQGDAGGGGRSGGGGSAGSGSGGTTGQSDAGMCGNREAQASAAVQTAVSAADLSCASSADCEIVSIDSDCHASCGALVSKNGKAGVQAAIAKQNADVCAGFEHDGCTRIVPPCIPPSPIGCVAGECRWLDGQGNDAGSGGSGDGGTNDDAGAPIAADGCFDRKVVFGPDGGLVAYQDQYTLSPCRTFALKRTAARAAGSDASCENEVAANAAVAADDVDAALASADMQAAIAAAPVLYGRDDRPVDGSVFRIQIDGAMIDIGSDCSGAPACAKIPRGVAAARAVLEALTMQQRKLGNCASVP